MPRTSRPVSVTLGDLQERVDAKVQSGAYATASEVLRAGVRALDREEEALKQWLREEIEKAFDDPEPGIPAEQVFAELRERHERRMKQRREDV